MTLCPVALAVGCNKCPVFRICPAKSTLGDYRPDEEKPAGTPETEEPSERQL